MLTGKQKRFLRSKAHHLKPITQIGKTGVNENMIQELGDMLEKRELLKISVLQNSPEGKETAAENLAAGSGAEIVQIIGNTIVFYKESEENKQIQLP